MSVTVKSIKLWRKEVENKPGELAGTLGPLVSAGADFQVLMGYRFPGNLRELKNLLERAAYRDTGAEISAADIGMLPTPEGSADGAASATGTFRERVAALERSLLADALRRANGNQAEAARRLGLTYDQFRHHARKHGVAE